MNQLEHEVHHSPPVSAKVNNAWTYPSIPFHLGNYFDKRIFIGAGIQESVQQLVMGWATEESECFLIHSIQTSPEVHPASYSIGTGGSFFCGKVAGREVYHSPTTSAKVKKTWIYTTTPTYVFTAVLN
jgi:hypothetical protein